MGILAELKRKEKKSELDFGLNKVVISSVENKERRDINKAIIDSGGFTKFQVLDPHGDAIKEFELQFRMPDGSKKPKPDDYTKRSVYRDINEMLIVISCFTEGADFDARYINAMEMLDAPIETVYKSDVEFNKSFTSHKNVKILYKHLFAAYTDILSSIVDHEKDLEILMTVSWSGRGLGKARTGYNRKTFLQLPGDGLLTILDAEQKTYDSLMDGTLEVKTFDDTKKPEKKKGKKMNLSQM